MTTNAALKQALESIEADHDSLIHDLQRMIAVDTCFPPGAGYGAFADLMDELVAPLGMNTRRVTVPEALWQTRSGEAYGERINLVARQPGDQEVCSLYFHVDTVPPGDGWTQPPLQLTEVEGKLIGRGTADMKGSIASTLAALRAAQRFNLPLRYCALMKRAVCIQASVIWRNNSWLKAIFSVSTAVPRHVSGRAALAASI